MVEAVVTKSLLDLPPAERPIDFRHISYLKIENKTEANTEVTVKLTVHVGKRTPSEKSGKPKYANSKEEIPLRTAESFVEAAKDVWLSYRKSSNEKLVEYINCFLTKKWEELEGEKLTNLKLHFDKDSEKIICEEKPRPHAKT